MENKILQGDALTKLKDLPEKSINMCMTSPPYWALRDYGTASWEGGDESCDHQIPEGEQDPKNKNNTSHNARFVRESCYKCGAKRVDKQLGLEPTFDLYIKNLCDIFDEVKRVLQDDGTCWVNLGDTYYGNSSYSNSGRAGFEQKDGNTNEWSRQFGDGKCLACGKPCKTQFCNRTCLNKMGNDFRSQNRQLPSKCLTMIPSRFAIEMINRGWILRNTIIWHKPNAMPSSVKDRFTVDFEYIFFFSKKKKYYFETQYEPTIEPYSENRAKRPITSKMKADYIDGGKAGNFTYNKLQPQGRNKRTTWTITTKPFKEAHFAVYPEELCETPIKSGCPEFVCSRCGMPKIKDLEYKREDYISREDRQTATGGVITGGVGKNFPKTIIKDLGYKPTCECNAGFTGGIILDPFFGAGTTGLVALKQKKKFIGIELNKEYIEIATKRLKPFLEQTHLDCPTEEN